MRFPPGLFGENLTTDGLEVSGALIGERWRIGTGDDAVEVMVRSPREPCVTFQHRMGLPRWVKRFTEGGRPGAYVKVLRPGTIGAGDPVTVLERPTHDVTVGHWLGGPQPARVRAMLASGVDLSDRMRFKATLVAGRE